MAPEAFAGSRRRRAATCTRSARPSRASCSAAAVRRPRRSASSCTRSLTPAASAVARLPAALADLIARLYARDAERAAGRRRSRCSTSSTQLAPAIAPDVARRARPAIAAPPAPPRGPARDAWIAKLAQGLGRSPRVHARRRCIAVPGAARSSSTARCARWQLERAAQRETRRRSSPARSTRSPRSSGARRSPRAHRSRAGSIASLVLHASTRPADRARARAKIRARPPSSRRSRAPAGCVSRTIAIVDPDVRTRRAASTRDEVAPLDVAGVTALAAAMLGRYAAGRLGSKHCTRCRAAAAQTTIELVRSLVHEPDPVRDRVVCALDRRRCRASLAPARGDVAPCAAGSRSRLPRVAGARGPPSRRPRRASTRATPALPTPSSSNALGLCAAAATSSRSIARRSRPSRASPGTSCRELAQRAIAGAGLSLDARAALLGHRGARQTCSPAPRATVAEDLLTRPRRSGPGARLARDRGGTPTQTIAISRTPNGADRSLRSRRLAIAPGARACPHRRDRPRGDDRFARGDQPLGAYEGSDRAPANGSGARWRGSDCRAARRSRGRVSAPATSMPPIDARRASARKHPANADYPAGAYARLLVTRSHYDEARRSNPDPRLAKPVLSQLS